MWLRQPGQARRPHVIEVANRLYPTRPGHTTVGALVTEPGWLATIPGDRPVIVVADGLLNLLPEHNVRQIFTDIADHLRGGQITFNITSTVVKRQREKRPVPLFKEFGIVEQWWLNDPRGVERFDPRLHFVEAGSLGDATLLKRAPLYYRLLAALVSVVPSWKNSGWILRYRF
jgi:O-methyltransferase involved in polyketide biosynthesis